MSNMFNRKQWKKRKREKEKERDRKAETETQKRNFLAKKFDEIRKSFVDNLRLTNGATYVWKVIVNISAKEFEDQKFDREKTNIQTWKGKEKEQT